MASPLSSFAVQPITMDSTEIDGGPVEGKFLHRWAGLRVHYHRMHGRKTYAFSPRQSGIR
jgi:hypothetical protein